jgi:hypothetical protein
MAAEGPLIVQARALGIKTVIDSSESPDYFTFGLSVSNKDISQINMVLDCFYYFDYDVANGSYHGTMSYKSNSTPKPPDEFEQLLKIESGNVYDRNKIISIFKALFPQQYPGHPDIVIVNAMPRARMGGKRKSKKRKYNKRKSKRFRK